jgi:hypothetical protein
MTEDHTKGVYEGISSASFLFSVNEGSKYPIVDGPAKIANVCYGSSVGFGCLKIKDNSNTKEGSYVSAMAFCSYSLPLP